MKVDWLEDFVALCEEGNFSRTARRRNVAQPALSRRIKSLENWAGAALFDRSSHPIRPTEEGRAFLPYAETALHALLQGKERLRRSLESENILKFASTHTISNMFFPAWFRSVLDDSSKSSISLQANHMASCANALIAGDCHFLLCYSDRRVDLGFDPAAYESKVVGRDLLIPITALDDDGSPRFQLPGNPDNPTPLLEYSKASALGEMVAELLNRKNAWQNLCKQSESPAADNLLSLAEQGHGITWIPQMRVELGGGFKHLALAGDDSWTIPVEIKIYKSMGQLPSSADRFWQCVEPLE